MDEENQIRHAGGDPVTLRLTALQADVLYEHIMETNQEADDALQFVLEDILDQLPEKEILSRPPSMETLIEIGYFDNELADADLSPDGMETNTGI